MNEKAKTVREHLLSNGYEIKKRAQHTDPDAIVLDSVREPARKGRKDLIEMETSTGPQAFHVRARRLISGKNPNGRGRSTKSTLGKTKAATFRLTPEAQRVMDVVTEREKVSKADIVEAGIRIVMTLDRKKIKSLLAK